MGELGQDRFIGGNQADIQILGERNEFAIIRGTRTFSRQSQHQMGNDLVFPALQPLDGFLHDLLRFGKA